MIAIREFFEFIFLKYLDALTISNNKGISFIILKKKKKNQFDENYWWELYLRLHKKIIMRWQAESSRL